MKKAKKRERGRWAKETDFLHVFLIKNFGKSGTTQRAELSYYPTSVIFPE